MLKVKVLSAHDKGSHAEVEVKVQKVLSQNTKLKIEHGQVTLYPESWTARGCTCPILNPGETHTLTQQGFIDGCCNSTEIIDNNNNNNNDNNMSKKKFGIFNRVKIYDKVESN